MTTFGRCVHCGVEWPEDEGHSCAVRELEEAEAEIRIVIEANLVLLIARVRDFVNMYCKYHRIVPFDLERIRIALDEYDRCSSIAEVKRVDTVPDGDWWVCANGHAGRTYLKSEGYGGDMCLSCLSPVRCYTLAFPDKTAG